MAEFWFTADTHFGHNNIIDHCNRPWKTSHLMDEALIEIWNQYVHPRDVVYVLGDFSIDINYDAVMQLVKKLHGTLNILKGNHDYWYKKDKRYFMHKYFKASKLHTWMCHYPLRSWPTGVNLHGHSHGTLEPMVNQFDVGVDTNPEYRPYHLEEILHMVDRKYLERRYRDNRR